MARMTTRGAAGIFAIAAMALALPAYAAQPASSAPLVLPKVEGPWPGVMTDPWPLGLLQKENLERPMPKAPWNLTGTWTLKLIPETGGFNFNPPPKLKPAAQALYEAGVKANAAGNAFRDDTGACWPAGMPKWWTRVWPIQIMQYPTGFVMVQGLMNAVRWIYLDGRGHTDPDIAVASFQGESIGRWEGDTLVVDTANFVNKRHWIQTGVPLSDQLHIVERIKPAADFQSFTVELTMTDPVNWEGEWKNTKVMVAVKGDDVKESFCAPDLNDHIAGTHSPDN